MQLPQDKRLSRNETRSAATRPLAARLVLEELPPIQCDFHPIFACLCEAGGPTRPSQCPRGDNTAVGIR